MTKKAASKTAVSVRVATQSAGVVINKNIYGQFAEHLGRGIYQGLWVGSDSTIPNTRGWRNDVVEALKPLRVPVLRWPGGCFADQYHWRDGVGPRDTRPVTVNSLWGGVEESNAVGTHEFFDLVELLGAEAYVNGNMGTGSPSEMADWIEYLTSESRSHLAEQRRSNGRDAPFEVHHFGLSNENWGAGGFMSPEHYTNLYKHWSTMLRPPWGSTTKFVASGGHGGEPLGGGTADEAVDDVTRWTEHLSANIAPNFLLKFDAISFHFYTHPTGDAFTERGDAIGFPEAEWVSALYQALRMDEFLARNSDILDRNDPDGHLGLYIDEWGTWYNPSEGSNPAFLEQQNTLRDALVAALNFHIFHRYADRVQMANIAQMVNVLQAMVLTDGDRILLTPTYHAFRMHVRFQDAVSLPVQLGNIPEYRLGDIAVPAISVSAARGPENQLHLSLTNVDPHNAHQLLLHLDEVAASTATGELLTAAEMDAHNTFDAPDVIAPQPFNAELVNGVLALELPAKSLLVLTIESNN